MNWFTRSLLLVVLCCMTWAPVTAQSPEFWDKLAELQVDGEVGPILKFIDLELARPGLAPAEQEILWSTRLEMLEAFASPEQVLSDVEVRLQADDLSPDHQFSLELARVNALCQLDRSAEAFAICEVKLADESLNPDHRLTWTWQRLGLMGEVGRTDEALVELETLLANPALTKTEREAYQSAKLRYLMEQGNWVLALAMLNAVLADDETEEWQIRHLLLQRAEVFDHLGQSALAQADRKQALDGLADTGRGEFDLRESVTSWVADRFQHNTFFENAWLERLTWWLGGVGLLTGFFVAIGNRQRREADGTWIRLLMIALVLALLTVVPVATSALLSSRMQPENFANAIVMILITSGFLFFCHVLTMLPPVRWLSGSEALPEATEELIARTHAIAHMMKLPPIKVRMMPSFNLDAQAFAGGLVAPSIVLADGILHRFNAQERDAIIAHELRHLANGTLWWFVLIRPVAALVSIFVAAYTGVPEAILWALLFYLGLFIIVCRRLEFDCDGRAAQIAGIPVTIRALDKVHAVHRMKNKGFWSRMAYATSTHPGRDVRLSAVARGNPAEAQLAECRWSEQEVVAGRGWARFFCGLWLVTLAGIFVPSLRLWYFWLPTFMLWFPFLAHQMAIRPDSEAKPNSTMRPFWIVTGLLIVCRLLVQYSDNGTTSFMAIVAAVIGLLIPVSMLMWLVSWLRPRPALQILQALQQRHLEHVLELGEKYARQIRKVPDARHNVALAKFLLHHDDEAIEDFEQLRIDIPKYEGAWQLLIRIFQELNDVQQAHELLEELRGRYANDLTWNAAMFDNALRRGNLTEARERVGVLEEMLAEPSPGCQARIASAEGNGERAWELLAEAERKAPGDVGIATLKVLFALRHGPAEKIEEYLAEAESLSQANPFAMCERRIARLRKEWEEQAEILEADESWVTPTHASDTQNNLNES